MNQALVGYPLIIATAIRGIENWLTGEPKTPDEISRGEKHTIG